eukprot:116914-Rhodomonas_salina.2
MPSSCAAPTLWLAAAPSSCRCALCSLPLRACGATRGGELAHCVLCLLCDVWCAVLSSHIVFRAGGAMRGAALACYLFSARCDVAELSERAGRGRMGVRAAPSAMSSSLPSS